MAKLANDGIHILKTCLSKARLVGRLYNLT